MRAEENKILEKVLFVGPDYRNHRGGIGAVLGVYNTFFDNFYFIPTYKPFDSNLRKSLYFARQLLTIVTHIASNKELKIVHIHSAHAGSFYRKLLIFFFAKLFGKKTIFHVHSGVFEVFYDKSMLIQKALIRWVINNSDVVICLSSYWSDFFAKRFACKHILIVNNVVSSPSGKIERAIPALPLNFVFLGRIGNNKGIFDVLTVLADTKCFSGKVKLYVGGDGEIERLEQFIKRKGLEKIVEYVGWVTDDRKAQLLLQAHVYILPSYLEGMPISVLEAMSYGLPIVSTKVGGIPEIVKHGKNGLLSEPGDLSAIRNSIKFFVDNPQEIITLGANSLCFVKPFTAGFVKKQLLDCYSSLLN